MTFKLRRTVRLVLLAALIPGCAAVPSTDTGTPGPSTGTHLFDAVTAIQDQWLHFPLRGETDYRLAVMKGRIAIRATGQQSASGLIRRVAVDPVKCPIIEWSWSVTKMQKNADLRVKDREDVAASIFLLFGDPGFLFDPKPVPTLRYVWTNGNVPIEAIVNNPYMPGTVRSIVVESGTDRIGAWITERRNVMEDFLNAFGYRPTERIHAVVLFTDNDQTQEPVEAYYGSGRVLCTTTD